MKQDPKKKLKKVLAKNHACYILITCEKPGADGEMQVEMSYEGDTAMASYLLQGAQLIIDEKEKDMISQTALSKIHPIHQ